MNASARIETHRMNQSKRYFSILSHFDGSDRQYDECQQQTIWHFCVGEISNFATSHIEAKKKKNGKLEQIFSVWMNVYLFLLSKWLLHLLGQINFPSFYVCVNRMSFHRKRKIIWISLNTRGSHISTVDEPVHSAHDFD